MSNAGSSSHKVAWSVACLAVVGSSMVTVPASARIAPAKSSVRVAGTGLHAARGAWVHLTDYTDSDSWTSSVIITGAVADFGSAGLNQRTGQFDLRLSEGSFTLQLADLDAKFLAVLRSLRVNRSTCSAFAKVSGRAPIESGAGTGAYRQLTGVFYLSLTLDEVFHRGACSELSPFLAQKIVTSGWGTIKNAEAHYAIRPKGGAA